MDLNKKERERQISFFLSRYFKLITAVWLLFIFLIGIFFVLWPKYQKTVAFSNAEHEKIIAEVKANEDVIKSTNKTISAYNQISQADLDKINLLLPSESANEELFPRVKEIITQNGLVMVSMSIEPEKTKAKSTITEEGEEIAISEPAASSSGLPGEIGKIKINLDISGVDYFSLIRLLDSFEKNLRIMDVDNINFDIAGNSVSLSLHTYYLKTQL